MNCKEAMLDLARRGGGSCPPLFAPLVRSVACQIEAISPLEMVSDPTRLAKGISELRRAAGLDVLVTATPCTMEAQALGAQVDLSLWPPRIIGPSDVNIDDDPDFQELFAKSDLLSAAIEVTERLAPETPESVAIVAGLTGPATLLEQLFGGGTYTDLQRDFVTAAVAALVRRFGQAGVDAIVFVESSNLPDDWKDLYGTAGNTAKFLKKPLVVVGSCGTMERPGLAVRSALVSTLEPEISRWDRVQRLGDARFVTTSGEVSADTPLGVLLDQIADAKDRLGI